MQLFKWHYHSLTYYEQSLSCEGNLTEKEIYNSLISFENTKSPGLLMGPQNNFTIPFGMILKIHL